MIFDGELVKFIVFFSLLLFTFNSESRAAGLYGLNQNAASTVLYEMQVQSANACDPNVGSQWQKDQCKNKLAPAYSKYNYVALNGDKKSCTDIPRLEGIKLGTFEDMLEPTDDFHSALTLNYIRSKIGPVMVWLQPPFPHNDRFHLPWNCDNTGSPYAVRDYMHMQGILSRACITKNLDENSVEDGKGQNCWGTDSFKPRTASMAT